MARQYNAFKKRMPTAIILFTCESGYKFSLADDIRKIPGVVEASIISGGYDLIAKVTSDTMDAVKEIIRSRIKDLKGIRTTLTLLKLDPQ